MKIAVMQPYLFPYIGYYQLINAVDKFVIYDDVNYITRGWINRNRLRINNGDYMFTAPLKGAGRNRIINEIAKADNFAKWTNSFLKMIENSFKRELNFSEIYPLVKAILSYDCFLFADLLKYSIEEMCAYLGITTEILCSSQIKKDCRLKGTDKIIDICSNLGASTYINPIGGKKLYSKSSFKDRGVELYFIETNFGDINNEQLWLYSVLQVTMLLNKDVVASALNKYKLI